MTKTLILGYGNPDRQDDGVAWHIISRLAQNLGRTPLTSFHTEYESINTSIDLLCYLQLTPELAETIAGYNKAMLIDAHTENIEKEINISVISPQFQPSPFTHHITPNTCLALAESLYGNTPETHLISVRGYKFDFSQTLSRQTEILANKAAQIITRMIDQGDDIE